MQRPSCRSARRDDFDGVLALVAGLLRSRRRSARASRNGRRIRSLPSRSSATTPRPARSAAPCSRACSRSATACCGERPRSAWSRRRRSSTSATVRRRLQLLKKGLAPADDRQDDLGRGSRSRSRAKSLAEGRPAVRRHGRQGQLRGVHRPEGHAVGGAQGREVLHRPGQHPRRRGRSSPTWSTRSRRRPGHLSLRLMAALDAGQAGGGDTRGMQSAAMLIVKKNGGVWLHNDVVLRLQVDDSPEPLKELRRLVETPREAISRPVERVKATSSSAASASPGPRLDSGVPHDRAHDVVAGRQRCRSGRFR